MTAPGSDDIFAKAAACSWGELTAYVDAELGALIIGIKVDESGRGLEVLVAPSAALDFALRLVGACERLEALRKGGEPA